MKGIGVSPGISIGRAYVVASHTMARTGIVLTSDQAVQEEVVLFHQAVEASIHEVKAIIANVNSAIPEEGLAILEMQVELLDDPQLATDVTTKIGRDRKSAHDAVVEAIQEAVQLLKNTDDDYFRARAADVQDIGQRILQHIDGPGNAGPRTFDAGTILIAEDLSPSDTILIDTSRIRGFATNAGGKTSHTAIIALSRGIPAVVGCGDDLAGIANNDLILLDGETGLILVNPSQDQVDEYQQKNAAFTEKQRLLQSLKNIPATTTDGITIRLMANIGREEDMAPALEHGAEGVGLLRTELLFLGKDAFPTEDEQFEYYKWIALLSKNKPVTIRTLDIGGDKQLPYFPLPEEQNPVLGYRAIRIGLDQKDILRTQLRAILRASAFGRLRILLPMISGVQEVRAVKEILAAEKKEVTGFDPHIPLGIMIEIPSAAIMADLLAKEVDFFSIGTNDLCQYTLAVDRMNERVKGLYDPYNPAVLRLISYTIGQAHAHNIGVCLCGELASDPLATLLLAGMGLEEFSMNAGSIPLIKNIILHSSRSEAVAVFKKVMTMDNSRDIVHYLEEVNR
ncbi:phosphoenolpyruvate--protein phosphotransferase [Dinghuibacter silviterrae]|uniref:Phosphoenolpyruvate-protein phosphotransferase n=1 Tax=Dinghuibacter silviterrae TaxID=1539049 RepID=A0A4R8DIW8_9BACT|nr:phosphoenolpyruvate--protein phosphotransferase [Dinghuibacter silviterrae]TDW97458.1 phosphotransferase system enzyme I (PtsI) [Dinghuibacter silviterrae]